SEGDFEVRLDVQKDALVLLFSNADEFQEWIAFSKGERARIAKAVQLALAQVTGAFLLVEDEGLEGLDQVGVAQVVDCMLSSTLGNVFFVSHDGRVADYLDKYPV